MTTAGVRLVQLDETAPLDDAWRRLDALGPDRSPFTGPAMVRAAAGTIAPADWALALLDGPNDTLRALLPVRPERVLPIVGPRCLSAFWSHYGPRSSPLLADADAADDLLEGLSRRTDVLRLRYAPLDSPSITAIEAAARRRGGDVAVTGVHRRAVLRPQEGSAALGSALQGSRLKELRRLWRRLGETGRLDHVVAEAATDVATALDDFARLEALGWRGRAGTGLAAAPERMSFARRLLGELAAERRVRSDLIRLDGETVAVLLTLRAGETAAIWKIAHDERIAACSPGAQLVRLATEAFLADPALVEVDSLATEGHPLIDRMWAGRRTMGDLLVGLSPRGGATVRRAAAAGRLLARGRAEARRLLLRWRRR